MSEEQVQEQAQEKKCCGFKAVVVLTIISLLFSIAALGTSIYAIKGGSIGAGGEGKKVVISKQYDRGRTFAKAQETNKPIIVFFYTDWCGYCQRFVPTFDKITKKSAIKKNFAIAYVNCEKEENKETMAEFNVQGFPTVYVIDEEGKKTQLDNGILFGDDAKDVVAKKALEIIGKE